MDENSRAPKFARPTYPTRPTGVYVTRTTFSGNQAEELHASSAICRTMFSLDHPLCTSIGCAAVRRRWWSSRWPARTRAGAAGRSPRSLVDGAVRDGPAPVGADGGERPQGAVAEPEDCHLFAVHRERPALARRDLVHGAEDVGWAGPGFTGLRSSDRHLRKDRQRQRRPELAGRERIVALAPGIHVAVHGGLHGGVEAGGDAPRRPPQSPPGGARCPPAAQRRRSAPASWRCSR